MKGTSKCKMQGKGYHETGYQIVSCAPRGIWWGHYEIQESGLDGPLAWSSRALLRFLTYVLMFLFLFSSTTWNITVERFLHLKTYGKITNVASTQARLLNYSLSLSHKPVNIQVAFAQYSSCKNNGYDTGRRDHISHKEYVLGNSAAPRLKEDTCILFNKSATATLEKPLEKNIVCIQFFKRKNWLWWFHVDILFQ